MEAIHKQERQQKINSNLEEEGWRPDSNPAPPLTRPAPSTFIPPAEDTRNVLNEESIRASLVEMGFVEKLSKCKEHNWGKAFHHRLLENNSTYPINSEFHQTGLR